VSEQLSPDAALWVARRGMILDLLNDTQPVDQQHNKRVAADIVRLMQEWDTFAQRVTRARFRDWYDLLRKVEAVRRLADELEADDISYSYAAHRIRQIVGTGDEA